MSDKLNITITIADQPPIPLTIKPEEEVIIRQAESTLNRLWTSWNQRFKVSQAEILAMVAFQFAKLYTIQTHQVDDAQLLLHDLETQVDDYLKQAK